MILPPPPPSPLLFCNLFFLISLHILHDSFNFNLIFPPSPTIYPSLALPFLPPSVSSCPFLPRLSTFFLHLPYHYGSPLFPLAHSLRPHGPRDVTRPTRGRIQTSIPFAISGVSSLRSKEEWKVSIVEISSFPPPLELSATHSSIFVPFGREEIFFSTFRLVATLHSERARTSRAHPTRTRLDRSSTVASHGVYASARPPTSRIDFPLRGGKFERRRSSGFQRRIWNCSFFFWDRNGSVNFVLSFF